MIGERPEAGVRIEFEAKLMSTVRKFGIASLQALEKLVDERLRIMNAEGLHTRDEAFAGFLKERVASAENRYIAAIRWDNVYGGRVSDIFAIELQARYPLRFDLR